MTATEQTYSQTPVLSNDLVRLEPLDLKHQDDLAQAVLPGELWKTWYTRIPAPDHVTDEIRNRLDMHAEHRLAPWAVIDPASSRAVGMTTFLNLNPTHRRLEIGSTWIGRDAQGTGINPAMKLLLLSRAFGDLGCIAVEFRTHWHNHQSRAAIASLGAKQDAVLRNHIIMDNGTIRDTVVFSILDTEWPSVKVGLEHRISKHVTSRTSH